MIKFFISLLYEIIFLHEQTNYKTSEIQMLWGGRDNKFLLGYIIHLRWYSFFFEKILHMFQKYLYLEFYIVKESLAYEFI